LNKTCKENLIFQTVANESGLRKDFTDNCFNQSFNRK
jgi:hypothetical protein